MLQRLATLINTISCRHVYALPRVFFFCNKTYVHKGKLENDVTLLSLVSENDDDDDYAYFNECIRNFLASPCSAQNKDVDSFN
jgi:hypothetical protein